LHLLPTFRYACTYRPSFLPVCLRGLKGHGFSVPKRLEAAPYRRFTGDVGGLGKGEILQWTRR
jgi:hypothetical protein